MSAIAAAPSPHTLAVNDGEAWACGSDVNGQLGQGSVGIQSTFAPAPVAIETVIRH